VIPESRRVAPLHRLRRENPARRLEALARIERRAVARAGDRDELRLGKMKYFGALVNGE